jgi:hypothetical protein
MVQNCRLGVESWRANCDFKLLLYTSNPKNPDPEDISRVTDYVVSYNCKGTKTMEIEQQHVEDFIFR